MDLEEAINVLSHDYLFTLNVLFLILITGGSSGLGLKTLTTAIIGYL
jgi:hypothetical protein